MKMKKYEITPFVKWVGGKRQLLNEIIPRMPKKINKYYEPFVGGGALFMELQNEETIINDISTELIEAYKTIRDYPNELMNLLDIHEEEHQKNPKEYFYKVRAWDREPGWLNKDSITKSARMLYLNKSCFNGMYRVNKKGQFNVPFNNKEKVITYYKENILSLSDYLQKNVSIYNKDFEEVVKTAKAGDFIFFDPPYDVLKKDGFDSYNPNGFGIEGQKRLAKVVHELSSRGCYVMLTNHDTKLINELYQDFNIDVVDAKRMINSNPNKRTGKEVIIYNYDIKEDK